MGLSQAVIGSESAHCSSDRCAGVQRLCGTASERWTFERCWTPLYRRLQGKRACVVGRSNIVGLPAALLLQNADATVTMVHSKTPNAAEICRQADIVIAACGRTEMVQGDWIKDGAVVIDVGINSVQVRRLLPLCSDNDGREARTLRDLAERGALGS